MEHRTRQQLVVVGHAQEQGEVVAHVAAVGVHQDVEAVVTHREAAATQLPLAGVREVGHPPGVLPIQRRGVVPCAGQ